MSASDTPAAPPASRSAGRRPLPAVVAAVVLAALLVVLRAHSFGSATALLSYGRDSPDYAVIQADLPHGHAFPGEGHDGQHFYVIARHLSHPTKAARYLDVPGFRYRRILYPALAGLLAPGGGLPLVYAFAALSIAGVAIGAWSLAGLRRAPPWLPLVAIVNPGVIAALFLSLSDALAVGLVLAAVAALDRRRCWLALGLLVLAALTRETTLVAGLSLALWPGLTTRWRVALAAVPTAVFGAWAVIVARLLHVPLTEQPQGGTFTWPILGWVHSHAPTADLLLCGVLVGVLVAALVVPRHRPAWSVALIGITLVEVVCAAPSITFAWYNATRVVGPALPLAVWVLTRRPLSRPPAAPASAP